MRVITESKVYNNIPSLLFYPEGAKNLPLVIFCHGFSNDKFEGSCLGLKLALEGYAVLSFDMDRHGERYDGFIEKIDSDLSFLKEVFSIIENTHKDIDLLLEEVKKDARINSDKIAMIGYSLGANICNHQLVNRDNISVCVSIIGSPNFTELMLHTLHKDHVTDLDDKEKDLLEYVKSLDPIDQLRQGQLDCPYLMINGKKDDTIPYKHSQDLFLQVKDTWVSDIDFILEDEYHFVSNSMMDSTIDWIKKYLI
jgi:fermentation-respiration switch protein FrsA (DUF1100 family)